MPRKVKVPEIEEVHNEVEETDVEDNQSLENEVIENVPETKTEEIPVISFDKEGKPKRKLTQKQLEALKRGREKGLAKLKEKGEVTKTRKEIKKKIHENDIKDVEELKKVAEFSTIDKKVESLYNKFNDIDSKISEMVEMKKKKQSAKYQNALKDKIKEEAQIHVYQNKAKEYNRWDYL